MSSFQMDDENIPVQSMQEVLNAPLSLLASLITGAKPTHCYANAWCMLITLPEFFYPDGQFVEGWTVFDLPQWVIVLEHGWCKWQECIVDPTIFFLADRHDPVFYIPGIYRSWEETRALEGEMLPHVRFDGKHERDGLGHPAYRAAYETAQRKAASLAKAVSPPKEIITCRASDPRDGHEDQEDRKEATTSIHIHIIELPSCLRIHTEEEHT